VRGDIIVTATEHNLFSSYRDALLEHLFLGALMRELWCARTRMEILKPQVEDAGYSIVLEANGVIRRVQLKSSHHGSTTAETKVNMHLANKPGGCVIWIQFDAKSLDLGPFLWFGGGPGEPLPDVSALRIAKHTKANADGIKLERPNLRVVPKGRFEPVESVGLLLSKLFGNVRFAPARSE
jgi:hypothetical protein